MLFANCFRDDDTVGVKSLSRSKFSIADTWFSLYGSAKISVLSDT